MSDQDALLRNVARANYGRSGIKCLRLFTVEPQFFSQLREECLRLTAAKTAQYVREQKRITNWVNHYGVTVQVHLDRDLCRTDDPTPEARARAAEYPTLTRFRDSFPGAFKMKVNGIGPGSGIPKHKEHIVFQHPELREFYLRLRFHLPIVSNPGCEMVLGGETFKFEEGSVYFFNRGAVHSARNGGTEFRYHIVWDMLVTAESYALMFDEGGAAPEFLTRVAAPDRALAPMGKDATAGYLISGKERRLYHRLGRARALISPNRFQDTLSFFAGLRPRRIALARPDWPKELPKERFVVAKNPLVKRR